MKVNKTSMGRDEKGRFIKGNQWWRLRTKFSTEKLFSSPEILREECYKYFEYTDERKWNKVDYKGKDVERVEIPTDTPYTLHGLCLYLNIARQTWINYRNDSELMEVVKEIDDIIYIQKFEGATVGAYNSSIIARDLGLVDKTENESKVKLEETVTIFELPNNNR